MKRILSVLTILAFTTSLAASAAESRLQNYVNKKLEPVTKKEQELNAKAEANRKANEARQTELKKQQEARQAELKKQQEARQAAAEKQRKEAQAKRQATKDAIKAETDYWKSLKK